MQLELFEESQLEMFSASHQVENIPYDKTVAQYWLWEGRLTPQQHVFWKRTNQLPEGLAV